MKKRKDIPEVKLSNEPLIPSTIGRIDEKSHNSWTLIVLFILLVTFIGVLPIITSYFEDKDSYPVEPPSNNKPKPENPEENNNTVFYPIKNDLNVVLEGMSFHSFIFDNKTVSLTINNNSEAKNYLLKHNLYLEIYNENKTLLQRIKLPQENINKGSSQVFTFDLISNVKETAFQIAIEEKTTEDYPPINLKKDSDGNYSLTCKKSNDTIFYTFDADQKLSMIKHNFEYSKSESDYLVKLTDYRQLMADYNALNGVVSSVTELGNGFTFTVNISLNRLDEEDKTVLNGLKHQAYYGKGTEGKVVYFELSTMNYQCSM